MNSLVPIDSDTGRAPSQISADAYVSMLSRFLELGAQDQSVLRALVYETMRAKLKRTLGSQLATMGIDTARAHIQALEQAIARVELNAIQAETLAEQLMAEPSGVPVEPDLIATSNLLYVDEHPRHLKQVDTIDNVPIAPAPRLSSNAMTLIARTSLATAALVAGLYCLTHIAPQPQTAGLAEQQSAPKQAVKAGAMRNEVQAEQTVANPSQAQVASTGALLPNSFGTFAVAGDKLYRLEPLSLRMPDERIEIGPILKFESKTKVPAGDIEFLIYRPNLSTNTPERAAVRVISKIRGSVSFESGKAVRSAVEDEWTIRKQTYPYSIYPVPNDPQMVRLKATSPDLVLPAGRYALVLKDQSFDFEINGGLADPSHCLERFQSTSGIVYVPCKN